MTEGGTVNKTDAESNGPKNGPRTNKSSNRGTRDNDKKKEEEQKRKRHPTEDSKVSIESLEEYIPTPPDGGWGWVIVLSSMICNLIVDGIGYSFGVFLSEFVAAFKEPQSKVSLVGSLLCGTYLFVGPAVSAMTNKYGCRPVVIVGSCIATVAFILAAFSPNIEIMILTYGVIGGIGLGMVYLPSIVSVGYYFEKKRAFATGLAVCGSGLGTFIFPPLSEVLLSEFSWRGGLLIIAGIISNACVCGALMRPLKATPPAGKASKKPRSKNFMDRLKENTHLRDRTTSESSGAAHSIGDGNKIQERVLLAKLQREKHLQDTDSDTGSLPSIAFVKRGDSGSGDHRRLSGGIPISSDHHKGRMSGSSITENAISPAKNIPSSPASKYIKTPDTEVTGQTDNKTVKDGKTSIDADGEQGASSPDSDGAGTDVYFTPPVSPPDTAQNTPIKDLSKEKEPPQNDNQKQQNGVPQSTISEFVPLLELPAPVTHPTGTRVRSQGGSRTNMTNLHSLTSLHVSKKDLARPLYRKDIFYSGSVLNIPQFRSQPDMKSYITSITTIPGEMEFVAGPSPSSKCINKFCSCLPRPARDILSEMVDVSLFKDISFMLICLGNVAAFLGFYVPFVFLVDLTVSLNVDKTKATFLISIIGITNTVGRVIIGKLADLHIVDSLVITYVSIAICGLVTALVPFCTTYPLLAVNAAVFGLGMAAYISLSSIIICDRMGLEKLTNAFGLLSMVRGIAGMLGPPLAGFMYVNSGSYDLSFYMGGLLLFIGAACHIVLHLPALRPKENPEIEVEEIVGEEILQLMGSKPQIITVDDAFSQI